MEHLYEAFAAKLETASALSSECVIRYRPKTRTSAWLLTMSLGYKFAMRSFSGVKSEALRQEGSVGLMEQSGRIMSEPTHS